MLWCNKLRQSRLQLYNSIVSNCSNSNCQVSVGQSKLPKYRDKNLKQTYIEEASKVQKVKTERTSELGHMDILLLDAD